MRNRRMWWPQRVLLVILVSGGIFTGCVSDKTPKMEATSEVEELSYGEDVCALTGDVIKTVRYGGRMTLQNGKALNFMSVECLAAYYIQMQDAKEISRMQVVDFTHGTRLMDVNKMVYLNSRLRPSPNGLSLTAIEAADTKMRSYIYDAYPGPMLEWDEVLELVGEKWNLPVAERQSGSENEEPSGGKNWIMGGLQ
ncbi:MAG: hypothetical protein WD315_00470 [Balneolaceae bacterium]